MYYPVSEGYHLTSCKVKLVVSAGIVVVQYSMTQIAVLDFEVPQGDAKDDCGKKCLKLAVFVNCTAVVVEEP